MYKETSAFHEEKRRDAERAAASRARQEGAGKGFPVLVYRRAAPSQPQDQLLAKPKLQQFREDVSSKIAEQCPGLVIGTADKDLDITFTIPSARDKVRVIM
eukprot:tig00021070_g17906.t1